MPGEHAYFRRLTDFEAPGRKYAKGASAVYTKGGLVSLLIGTGTIRMSQAGDIVLGICRDPVAATDSNYADTTPIEVEHLSQGDEVICPVSAGTIALTQVGDEADVVNGGLSLTLTESNNDFRIFGQIGSSLTELLATPIAARCVF